MSAALLRIALSAALFFWVAAVGMARAEAPALVAEPEGYRTNDYRMPVPKTLAGARVVDVEEVERLWRDKGAVFIDVFPRAPKPPNLPSGTVWRDPTHQSIDGAHWLPNVGYGVLTPELESYFKTRLASLGGEEHKPILFFCLKDCWMSWNAAKRALAWGYKDVLWFPEGTDGWQENGFDLVRVEPVP
jgi:PQQ-dependent catabolism-associated CXXCW motif protein